jgi:hypothetical protein
MYRHHHGPMLDLVRVTAPTPLFTTDELKLALRVDHSEDDALIDGLAAAVTAHLDGFSGILGRALVTQSWKLYLPGFPPGPGPWGAPLFSARLQHARRIVLPLPPLVSVTSIHYVDPDGADQLLAADQYTVLEGPVSAVEPAYGLSWPSTRAQARAVTITYVAGYGAATDVPGPILAAAKLMVGDLYANREAVVIKDSRVTLIETPTTSRLLSPFKIPRT